MPRNVFHSLFAQFIGVYVFKIIVNDTLDFSGTCHKNTLFYLNPVCLDLLSPFVSLAKDQIYLISPLYFLLDFIALL